MAVLPVAAAPADQGWWPWVLALLAFFAGIGGTAWWMRRNARRDPQVVVPPIVAPKPRVQTAPSAAPPPPPSPSRPAVPADDELVDEPANAAPLRLAFEARQLSISLTAATLDYRITITNAGEGSLEGLAIAGDMISAHASRSENDQLASAASAMVRCHALDRLGPGETTTLTGSFRLPLQQIMPIRSGDAALFVPLARLKAEVGAGFVGSIVQNAVVGQRSPRPGAGLQPFRLDLGPRIYREVTQRVFA